jgi:hypothetical protein
MATTYKVKKGNKVIERNRETGDVVSQVDVAPKVDPQAPPKNRIFSRPAGTDPSRNIDITDLPKEERQKIQKLNAYEGQERLRQEDLQLRRQAKETIVQEKLAEMDAQQEPQPSETEVQPTQIEQQAPQERTRGEIIKEGFSSPQAFKEELAQSTTAVGQGTLAFVSLAADVIRTAITGKKPLGVQQAENTFNEATGVISKNIEAVKLNPLLYYEAKRDFDRAEAAIIRLESNNKKEGQLSLRYWRDNGAELEATIANEKAILADLRRDLETAKVIGVTSQLG